MRFDEAVVRGLFERYKHLHPMVLHRSLERAKRLGELFDILDGCPAQMPVVWDESLRKWVSTDLLRMVK